MSIPTPENCIKCKYRHKANEGHKNFVCECFCHNEFAREGYKFIGFTPAIKQTNT